VSKHKKSPLGAWRPTGTRCGRRSVVIASTSRIVAQSPTTVKPRAAFPAHEITRRSRRPQAGPSGRALIHLFKSNMGGFLYV